jgi:starch-binding outer membrane protein, SusD/RagB family
LSKQAADAFGELLKLADETGRYKLQTWATWTECFYRRSNLRPGGTEVIMTPTIYDRTRVRNSTLGAISPSSFGLNSGNNAEVPTHNFSKYFGMANGLPIDDPNSGFNPNDPWVGRDPRFYKTYVIDGEKFSNIRTADYFAQLHNTGYHRIGINPPTVTGYYQKKFNGLAPDFTVAIAGQLMAFVPYLRLADVYLMYAEAVLFSPNGTAKQYIVQLYHDGSPGCKCGENPGHTA